MQNTNKKNTVQSVVKIFDILETLAKHKKGAKLTKVAEELNYPTSTTHRFLTTLLQIGYVAQNTETGEYSLGVKLLSLSKSVLHNLDLRKAALPFLKKLRDQTSETANLVVLDSDEVLYIEKAESRETVRVFSLIGKRAPAYATGVGKVLLADMAWPDVVNIIKMNGMQKMTPNTITDLDDFMEELNKIRKQGFAFDREECEKDVMCVAAPIRNHTGKAIASISISAPKVRFNINKTEKWIELLKKECEELSEMLGYVSLDLDS